MDKLVLAAGWQASASCLDDIVLAKMEVVWPELVEGNTDHNK